MMKSHIFHCWSFQKRSVFWISSTKPIPLKATQLWKQIGEKTTVSFFGETVLNTQIKRGMLKHYLLCCFSLVGNNTLSWPDRHVMKRHGDSIIIASGREYIKTKGLTFARDECPVQAFKCRLCEPFTISLRPLRRSPWGKAIPSRFTINQLWKL